MISNMTVTPGGDQSLLVQWKALDTSSLSGYVIEWRPLLQTDLSHIQFEIADRNQSSLVITGMFDIAGFKIFMLPILLKL